MKHPRFKFERREREEHVHVDCEEWPCAALFFALRMTQLGKIRASRGRLNFPRPF